MGRKRNITAHNPVKVSAIDRFSTTRISRRRAPCTISYLAVPLGRGPLGSCTLNLDWGLLLVADPPRQPCHLLHTLA